MYDLIIIGSGPAGLSAGVYAKRAMLEVMVIEKGAYSGGQIVNAEKVDNYLGMYGVSGFAMAMSFKEHADKIGVPFMNGEVTTIEDGEYKKTIYLKSGEKLETKAVIIATGARHRKLNVPGETKLSLGGVSYCATCDGAFYRGKKACVVGGGDVALSDALYLAKGCEKVYLIHRRKEFRASKHLIKQVENTENIEFLPFFQVKSINGEDFVSSVTLYNIKTEDTKDLEVSGVFVAVGMEPETDFVSSLNICDEFGYINAGENCETKIPGIFAAGDVRIKAVRQIATAVADGASAVAAIEKYVQ